MSDTTLNGGSIRILWDASTPAVVTITGNGNPSFTVAGSAVTFPYTLNSSTTFDTIHTGNYVVSVLHNGVEVAETPDGVKNVRLSGGGQAIFSPTVDAGGRGKNLLDELAGAFAAPLGASDRVRYVSPTGSNTNDGFSVGRAKATIQAAYDALPAEGGWIVLGHGRHNVGAGLVFSKGKPVRMSGFGEGMAARFASINVYNSVPDGVAPVVYSNTNPAHLVTWSGNGQAYGCAFVGIAWEVTGSNLTSIFDGDGLCHSIFRDNLFWFDTTALATARAIDAYCQANPAITDDSSWLRIENNVVVGGGLVKFGTSLSDTAAFQADSNQNVVTGNVGLGRDVSITSAPFIEANRMIRSYIAGNNVEAYKVGEVYRDCLHNTMVGDGGEQTTTFVRVIGGTGNSFAPVGITSPSGFSAVMFSLENATHSNILTIPSVITDSILYAANGDYTDLSGAIALVGSTFVEDQVVISPYESVIKDRNPRILPAFNLNPNGTGATKVTAGLINYIGLPDGAAVVEGFGLFNHSIPRSWRRVDVYIQWMCPTATVTGDVRWRLQYTQPGVGALANASTVSSSVTASAPGTQWQVVETKLTTLALDPTKPLALSIQRLAADALDTCTGTAGLTAVVLKPR